MWWSNFLSPKIVLGLYQKPSAYINVRRAFSNSVFRMSDNTIQESNNEAPVPPDWYICCSSHCATCIWVKYVTQVCKYYNKDPNKIKEALSHVYEAFSQDRGNDSENVHNASMKAFIETEVKSLLKKS